MRKISANYIFPVSSAPLKNGIIVLDDANAIIDVIDTGGKIKEIQNLQFYSGMIVPGFVDVFTLLSYPSFTKGNFQEIIVGDFFNNLKKKLTEFPKDADSFQRGINHLEAFGTVAAADFFPLEDNENRKKKSKVKFIDHDFSECALELPLKINSDSKSILLNQFVLELGKSFTPTENEYNRYCVGTGSLATHQKLSIFEEIKAVQELFPELSYFDLLSWATINGAKHLQLDDKIGSIEIGKTPGLNLLTKLDYTNKKLTKESELKVLL